MNATARNIHRLLESSPCVRVRHHLGDTVLIDDAKPLGFGTKCVMVRVQKGGWIVINPLTWSVEMPG